MLQGLEEEKKELCSNSELLSMCAESDACCCAENCLNAGSYVTVQLQPLPP